MATGSSATPSGILGQGGINWGWLLALGILMTLLGIVGLGMTYWLTIAAVFWCGVLALIAGIAQILDAFHHKNWKGIVWHVGIGVVYVVAGIAMVTMPVASAFWLTLFIAISLVVVGFFRIVMAFQIRGRGPIWIVVLLSGVITAALGAMVYGTIAPPGADAMATSEGQLAWVRSWGWVIGLFVAIQLIMEGVALISLALAARSAPGSVPSVAPNSSG
jgi:uncharacterized membrane protein HdeD (DUF308 family)